MQFCIHMVMFVSVQRLSIFRTPFYLFLLPLAESRDRLALVHDRRGNVS